MPRLTAKFWVDAYLRRLSMANIPAFVVHKGDISSGAVLIKSNHLDGRAIVYHRVLNAAFEREWGVLQDGVEADIDNAIEKQRSFDPDLWVLEVEDRAGRTLLDEDGLSG